MRWENLTVPDFEKAVVQCQGVGVIPVGVIEPHASHLPLGTDMLAAHWTACQEAGAYSPVDWYAMYPRMYVGDARPSTAAKGQVLAEHRVAALVRLLRAVKQDQVTAGSMAEFQGGAINPRSPWEHTKDDA